jgi:hypothetical protein
MSLWDRPNGPTSGAANSATQTALNTQAAQSGPLPALQVITGTSETVILSPENSAVPLTVTLPPDTANEQSALDLVATGYVKTTNSTNITLKFYSGTSLTTGSDTLLGSSGALALNTATCSFKVKSEVQYDSVSGLLVGTIEFYFNKAIVAKVTWSNFPTGVNNTSNPVASFLLTITSSAATALLPTTINVQKFSVG